MEEISKSTGTTKTERYLAKLCERSFLSLWSYPNLYTDEGRKNSKGSGKELCDLLVVFGDHVIIFSDKNVDFKNSGNLQVDWRRWVKRAVLESARQVYGAEKWIRERPDRIFLNKQCTERFPLRLPDPVKAKFHRIVVALNVTKRFNQHVGGRGTLILKPEIIGSRHLEVPFHIGQIDPEKGYIHIFDDISLDIILRERDTAYDFVEYLLRKEKFITSGQLGMAAGEEELLAYYLSKLNPNDEHDFPIEQGVIEVITEGLWDHFRQLPQYINGKKENEASYFWDWLIEQFAVHMIKGTMEFSSGDQLDDNAMALRIMARENRFSRRILSKAFMEKIESTPPHKRKVRVMFSPQFQDVGYVLLLYPKPADIDMASYKEHRKKRTGLLSAYCKSFKAKHPELNIIVGIASEPKGTGSGSKDLLYLDTTGWSDAALKEANRIRQEFALLLDDKVKEFRGTEYEFPLPKSGESSQVENKNNHSHNKFEDKILEQSFRKRKDKRRMSKESRRRNRKKR